MNKYQEVLNRIKVHVPEYKLINNHIVEVDKHSDLCKLQKLVDKETPMKPPKHDKVVCPSCNSKANYGHPYTEYCCHCGQKIDWSDEE